jgi:serine/threonine protein kinase
MADDAGARGAINGSAIAAPQAGVVHCDVKPDNIVRCKVGDTYSYRLVDFGTLSAPAIPPSPPTFPLRRTHLGQSLQRRTAHDGANRMQQAH